jgi:hypothetical protein
VKRGRQRAAITTTLAALLAAGGCASTTTPVAEQNTSTVCTDQTLQGRYIAKGELSSAPNNGGSGSGAYTLAYIIFDAEGKVEVVRGLSSSNGNNIGWEGKGHYTINADCSGEMSLSAKVADGIDIKMNFDLLVRNSGASTVIESIFVIQPGKTSGQLTLYEAGQ